MGKKGNVGKKRKGLRDILREKKRLLIILGTIVLAIALIAVIFGTKIKFLTKDELHISLDPVQKSIYTENGRDVRLNVTIKNVNIRPCSSVCSMGLFDPYTQTMIYSENFTLKSNREYRRELIFSGNKTGHGQSVYYIEAQCRNMKSLLCSSSENTVYRTGFVSFNHELSYEEKEAKDSLRGKLTDGVTGLNAARWSFEELKSSVESANEVFLDEESLSAERDALSQWETFLWRAHTLWKAEEYLLLQKEANDGKLAEFAQTATGIDAKKRYYEEGIESYNEAAMLMNTLALNMKQLNDIYRYYIQIKDFKRVNEVQETASKAEDAYDAFLAATFGQSSLHQKNLELLNESVAQIEIEYSSVKDAIDAKGEKAIDDTLAMIQRQEEGISKNTSLVLTGESCADAKRVSEEISAINSLADNLTASNFSGFVGVPEFDLLRKIFEESVSNGNFGISYNGTHYLINGTSAIENTLNISSEEYYLLAHINASTVQDFLESYCNQVHDNLTRTIYFSLLPLIVKKAPAASDVVEISFGEADAKCCIFSTCGKCGTDASLHPVIFIHGHSFNKKNDVESSLSAFSKMQTKMGHEEELINAGDIDVQSKATAGYWSEMGYPLTVRASYYYLYYYDLGLYASAARKTEGIENYAIRLKELVDTVKARTGATKVDIVAHSMGGLVAREYMTLFGEDSVNKLVLIGTPNYGISGKPSDLCPTYGASQECADMAEGSIFLKRLNAAENVPKTVKAYTIRGIGCDTDDADGDGVVKASNVELAYATNYAVRGLCPSFLGFELHTDLLDPDKYPEVYNRVIAILKEG